MKLQLLLAGVSLLLAGAPVAHLLQETVPDCAAPDPQHCADAKASATGGARTEPSRAASPFRGDPKMEGSQPLAVVPPTGHPTEQPESSPASPAPRPQKPREPVSEARGAPTAAAGPHPGDAMPVDGPGAPEGMVELRVLASASYPGVEELRFRLARAEIESAPGAATVLVDEPVLVELLGAKAGAIERVAREDAPTGTYALLRLVLGNATVVSGNKSYPVALPADNASTLRLPGDATVDARRELLLTLDLDLQASLRQGRGGWSLVPAWRVLVQTAAPSSKLTGTQLAALAGLKQASEAPSEIRLGEPFGVPASLSGRWRAGPSLVDAAANAKAWVEAHAGAFRLGSASGFHTSAVQPSRLGFTAVRLHQEHEGVPVFGGELVVRLGPGAAHGSVDEVLSAHGTLLPDVQVDTKPRVDARAAREAAVASVKASQQPRNSSAEEPSLVIYNPAVLDPAAADTSYLAWLVAVRTAEPAGIWQVLVDAASGKLLATMDGVDRSHPSRVWDAGPSPDVLWFEDHAQERAGTPPAEATRLNTYGDNYYDYLLETFGQDSIDGDGMRMVGRVNIPSSIASNGCWGCVDGEVVFRPGWVVQDVVAHELSHGLIAESAGDFLNSGHADVLDEHFADVFGEFLDCQTACNWLNGQDAFGRAAPGGVVRNLIDPTLTGDPDHYDDYVVGGLHTNAGVPNKVVYLLAQGGTHYGITVGALGVAKAEQLVYATLMDSALTSSATFELYRDVMLMTCQAMMGGAAGLTSADCRQVVRAWCSVGLCALTQNAAGAASEEGDGFGNALAAGDFNGDGFEDLAIGAALEDPPGLGADAGAVSVLYGGSAGLGRASAELLLQEDAGAASEAGDRFGTALAAADFDGDGFDDLAVGVPHEDYDGASDAGMVAVFYGSAAGLLPASFERIGQADAGASVEDDDLFGWALAAGDLDGDGFGDLAVGVPREDVDGSANAGQAIVFYGSAAGLRPPETERLTQEDAGAASEAGDRFGRALAIADFDGDGFGDLAVAAPHENLEAADVGQVIVFYGSAAGLEPVSYERFSQGEVGASEEDGDHFGWALAAADFDGDGFADLAVGVPYEDTEGATDAGMVAVLYGSASGLLLDGESVGYERLVQEDADAVSEGGDRFGLALAAGDLNGNGFADLAVGAPYEDWDGETNNGLVVLLYGAGAGLRPATYLRLGQSGLGGAEEDGDHFGLAVVLGDFDGDGDDELAAGAPGEDLPGAADAGAVYAQDE